LPLAKPIASPSASAVPGQPASAAGQGGFQTFALQSTAFTDGAALPPDFTCDGAGQSPPMAWSGAPVGTAAYALIEQDADAKSGSQPFTEWLVYNMPRSVTQLSAGVPSSPLLSNGSQQGTNDAHTVGYMGACPDHGQPAHHLTFELFAQDGYVTLETGASYADVHDALMGHTIAQTQLNAVVQR
jgi:Raf kinase inhibitor-like YbhB/YbcL family protein